MHKTDLIVALDFPKADLALKFTEKLGDLPVIYKVGVELFMCGGPDLLRELVHRKHRVFLDLKFYDIPNQVSRAAQQAAFYHVEMMTLHISGGESMVRKTAEVLQEIPTLRPKLLGVSVLTSFDHQGWRAVTEAVAGRPAHPGESVQRLVALSSGWGLDGIVCSTAEVSHVRKYFPAFYTVVPGIRPRGSDTVGDDQKRVATPVEAAQMGAHAIVVGRPITANPEPKKIAEGILRDLCPSG